MSPTLFLAIKGLSFRLKQTMLCISGVVLGVVALTTILSVANGFERALIENILETAGHIQVYSRAEHEIAHPDEIAKLVSQVPGVVAVAPAILVQAMIESENGQTFAGANVKAVDPVAESQINGISKHITEGAFRFDTNQEIILGDDLAGQLHAKLAHNLTLTIPDGTKYKLKVAGIYHTGMPDFDSGIVLISIPMAQKAFGYDKSVSHLFVRTEDPMAAGALAKAIKTKTGYDAQSWLDRNRQLLEAIAMERRVMFVVIFLTLIVAAFGIANILTMIVLEKYRDIGILRALGMPRGEVVRLFLLQGIAIGVTGTVLGCAGGLGLGWLLQRLPIALPLEVYYVDHVPVLFRASDFWAIALLAVGVSLVASYFPARKAVKIQPVEAIRYYA